jgi:hypothetical protein
MGTKRVGLARTKALIINLKRDLAMGGTRFTDVKGVEMCVYSDAVSSVTNTHIEDQTGLIVPANSVITGAGVVVSTVLAAGAGTMGVTFGTAAAGEQIVADDPNSLVGSVTSLAAGKGVSSHSHETTAMGGLTALAFVGDCAYSTSARTIYGAVTTSGSGFTSGAVKFWITYRLVG